MPSDAIQHVFQVGDKVNVVLTVTAIGGTTTEPTVTGTTVYAGYDGNTDVVGPLDAKQVIQAQ